MKVVHKERSGKLFHVLDVSSLKEAKDMKLDEGFINEPVSVTWIEEDASKPFKFRGKALKVDRKNLNRRRYRKELTEKALKESRRFIEKGQVLTVMDGHPKRGDTAVTPIVGKVVFGDLDVDGWMPYEATVSDTSRGMDVQKLLKDKCIGEVSLRSKGRTAIVKVNGEPIDDVIDLHFRGLDLVTEGSEEGAGVENVFNSYLLESYWEESELLEAIGGSKTLPLDPSGLWDATAAEKRIRSFAGGPDKADMDWAKYQKAFVWYDTADKENFGSYKLPFADVIGGKLTAVWGGVNTAMGVVNGAMGGIDISSREKKLAYNFLVGYYKKFDKTPPAFKGEMGGDTEMKLEDLTIKELKTSRTDLVETIRTEEKEKLNKDLVKAKADLKKAEAKAKVAEDATKQKVAPSEEVKSLTKEVTDLKEKVGTLEAEKKLRESKEVYLKKVKDSDLTEEMTTGLEKQCLGKMPERMDKIIEARIKFVQQIRKSETIGLIEKKGVKKDPKEVKAEMNKDVKEAFGG